MSIEEREEDERRCEEENTKTRNRKHPDMPELNRTRPTRKIKPSLKKTEHDEVKETQKTKKEKRTKGHVEEEFHSKKENSKCRGCGKYVKAGVMCDKGERWWHYSCIKIKKDEVIQKETFVCFLCQDSTTNIEIDEINKNLHRSAEGEELGKSLPEYPEEVDANKDQRPSETNKSDNGDAGY